MKGNKGKWNNMAKDEDSLPHPRKDLSKIKSFICQNFSHYASKCVDKKDKEK